MTISQTRERNLFVERLQSNDVLKSIVYVEYCEEIQLNERNAKRRKMLVPEVKLLGNGGSVRHGSPEINESRRVHFCYKLQIGPPVR